jgi:ribose 5-phosphate isomerase B
MKILIASDHAGFELKEKIKIFLKESGYEVEDKGAFEYKEGDDYPDFVVPLAKEVSQNPELRGIILGGSGQGEAICANRFPNVRAIVFNGQYDPSDGRVVPHEIVLSREHNDSNVLSLGARFLNENEAKEAVEQWLKTPFSGDERHKRRIKKLEANS